MVALPDRKLLMVQVMHLIIIRSLCFEQLFILISMIGVVRGSYELSSADGIKRIVNYIADKDGFRAQV